MCFSGLTNIFFYFKKCNMIPFLINIESFILCLYSSASIDTVHISISNRSFKYIKVASLWYYIAKTLCLTSSCLGQQQGQECWPSHGLCECRPLCTVEGCSVCGEAAPRLLTALTVLQGSHLLGRNICPERASPGLCDHPQNRGGSCRRTQDQRAS